MKLCGNCGVQLSCGCQRRDASDGKSCCDQCINAYELSIAPPPIPPAPIPMPVAQEPIIEEVKEQPVVEEPVVEEPKVEAEVEVIVPPKVLTRRSTLNEK